MNFTYNHATEEWISCCLSNKQTFRLSEGKRVVKLKAKITQFINLPYRGQVTIPANLAILNFPEELIDSLLDEQVLVLVQKSEYSTGAFI